MGALAAAFARASWRKAMWWAVAYTALAAMEGAFYPTIRSSAATMTSLLNAMPAAFRQAFGGYDLHTFGGWMSTEFFAYFGLLAAMAAAFLALDVVLRERDRHTLEEWLALPVSRGAFFWGRIAVWLVLTLAAVAPVPPLLWGMARGFSSPLPAGGVVGAALLTFALGAVFGAAVLAAGMLCREMGPGVALALALPFLLYMANVVLQAANRLAWLQRAIPFHYYRPAATLASTHPPLAAIGGLLLAAAILLLVAWWAFERREVAGS
jgi:ABC-type transport system involved in multi-copper enzyme maturation permease subunit